MLRLILGRAGSGKTEYVRGLLARLAREGHQRMILLVPEQFSFESERALLRLLGPRDAMRVEVLSFTRLADTVRRACGGACGTRLDDGGRILLMSLALESVQDKLEVYSRHVKSAALARELLQISAECKQCAVLPEALLRAAQVMEPCALQKKTRELALILEAYDALVAQSFVDDQDELTRLADTLRTHRFFTGYTVAVDAFKGFTAQERRVLARVMEQADETFITLCADTLREEAGASPVFSQVRRTGNRLIAEAKRCNVRVAQPVTLTPGRRFQAPPLAALEERVFLPDGMPYEEDAGCVTLCAAQDRAAECDFVACTAKRLMRTQGIRCREMAVIARNAEEYQSELTAALKRYDIPVFEDARQPVTSQPLIALVRNALAALCTGFDSEAVLRYLKTGLAGFSVEETAALENYVLLWQLSGAKWKKEWTDHPDGFQAAFSQEDQARLARLNDLRARVTEPLLHLQAACRDTDGAGIAAAVWDLLEETDAAGQVRALAAALDDAGEPALAEEQDRVWNLLVELLDQSAVALRGRPVSLARFAELFEAVLAVQDLGSIPQGLDEMTVGSADRVRTGAPRVVFVVGANEGVFPRTPQAGGLLSDRERRRLIEAGIELADPCEYQAADERFLAYAAVCAASEQLVVTYARADASGAALTPGPLVSELKRLFPRCVRRDTAALDGLDWIESERAAFSMAARRFRLDDPLSASLRACFENHPAYLMRLEAVGRAARREPFRFQDPSAAQKLFGRDLTLSASRVETFHRCRFQFFCKYGLNARPRGVARLDPMQSGTVLHYVLERLLRQVGGKGLAALGAQERRAAVERLLEQYVDEQMGGLADKPGRFQYLLDRLGRTLDAVVEQLAREFAHSDFEPADFELPIGGEGAIPPYTVQLEDGSRLRIQGFIDRVDTMEQDGRTYLRVVDYKSSAKSFQLSDVLQGLNMQMVLYLLALWKNGGVRYGEVVPAGVLYMPARLSIPSLPREAEDREIEAARMKTYRMSGMVLDDALAVHGMEHEGSGVFIPAKPGKNGLTGTLFTLEQLGRLERRADVLLAEMALELRAGDIPALPAWGADYPDVCAYCDYRSVCGHEADSPVRKIEKFRHEESLKQLEGGDGDGAELDEGAAGRD